MKWNELKILASEINKNHIIKEVREDRPIIQLGPGIGKKEVISQLKEFFTWLSDNWPDWNNGQNEFELSELAFEFFDNMDKSNGMFAQVPFDFWDKDFFIQTTPVEWKILGICMRYASIKKENWGEFFLSNTRIAKESGLSENHIGEYIASLKKKGFLVNIRKHNSGTWVRKINFIPDKTNH